jgi:hypothetical protein
VTAPACGCGHTHDNLRRCPQIAVSHDGFAAVGCGYLTALGALHATAALPPLDRARTALEAAAHVNEGVRPPFTMVTA